MKFDLSTTTAALILLGAPSASAELSMDHGSPTPTKTKSNNGPEREKLARRSGRSKLQGAVYMDMDPIEQNKKIVIVPRTSNLRGAVYMDMDPNEQRKEYDNASLPHHTVDSNIKSFVATSTGTTYDIRHAYCYTWDGQHAKPVSAWPVLNTRTPTDDCSVFCSDSLVGCTGWEWRESRNECHFFNARNGGNFLPTSKSEICGWRV